MKGMIYKFVGSDYTKLESLLLALLQLRELQFRWIHNNALEFKEIHHFKTVGVMDLRGKEFTVYGKALIRIVKVLHLEMICSCEKTRKLLRFMWKREYLEV